MNTQIKKQISIFSRTAGFTLIELLVVIGIIGILAAIIIAALDPVEQLRKGADTSAKNASVQLVDAVNRYYASKNLYPWDAGGVTGCNAPNNTLMSAMGGTCINGTGANPGLIGEGELKSSFMNSPFMNAANATQVTVNYVAATQTLTACFQPQSKSQQKDPNTKFTAVGGAGAGCKSQGGANNCFWCAQ
jgi:prepilin-type N-terminal cleavage/methylation domain-containing protein